MTCLANCSLFTFTDWKNGIFFKRGPDQYEGNYTNWLNHIVRKLLWIGCYLCMLIFKKLNHRSEINNYHLWQRRNVCIHREFNSSSIDCVVRVTRHWQGSQTYNIHTKIQQINFEQFKFVKYFGHGTTVCRSTLDGSFLQSHAQGWYPANEYSK